MINKLLKKKIRRYQILGREFKLNRIPKGQATNECSINSGTIWYVLVRKCYDSLHQRYLGNADTDDDQKRKIFENWPTKANGRMHSKDDGRQVEWNLANAEASWIKYFGFDKGSHVEGVTIAIAPYLKLNLIKSSFKWVTLGYITKTIEMYIEIE